MSGFAALTETIVVPAWVLGAVAALFVAVGAFSFSRTGSFAWLVRLSVVVMVGLLAWGVLERLAVQDRLAERHALDVRLAEFAGRGMAPGSPLTCLDAVAGEAVETACEKALFATPESVAAAVAYVSAGLELLADGVEFSNRSGESYGKKLAGLRRAIEADRYGFVAHVLASRDKCTAEQCDAFALMQDPAHVKANLLAGTFDSYVTRHAEAWPNATRPGNSVAAAPGQESGPALASAGGTAAPVPSRYTFPSADSIPAVSIMNPEPTGPVPDEVPATASAPEAIRNPPMPPRRPSPRTAQRQPAPAPVPLVPAPGLPATGAIEPASPAAPSQ
ncbi:MAG TPA: hypothetical protein VHA77_10040 [Xanthobacteraceae bacterium]|jgi:hypothetical protein|nr:hypothetical protein [Xanthobacteraceae bacterium]